MSATSTVQRVEIQAADPAPPARPARSVERLRLTLVTLCLALLVFAQSAGNASTDTKLDLVVTPLRFLSRALRLWDPIGAAGQLQNQAYGFLFPMGPFFALTHAAGLAPWEMQRFWEAALVVAAFLGGYRLSRRLGVAGFWPAVGAGLVYALAPRTLSELTSISSELMPVAALPWMVLPLVGGARYGSPRRAAARSGVAVLFAGGVNAAATLAVLPVPALWLLTRERGPRRRALMSWWVLAVLLACAWWLIPLALLGKYSPPFLDWIESSSTTTLPTSLLASLRGVDHWESYLGADVWPAGWIFASAPATIVATTAVAGVGLAGLARRGLSQRLFLWATLLLGLVLVTAGHAATIGPPGAGTVRDWLDGPLVAFRNVHKFDPLIRLPLAIGVGHALASARLPRMGWVRVSSWRLRLPLQLLAAGAAVAVGLVAISPAVTNHLVSSQRVTPEPGWWRQAAAWLSAKGQGARALVVPGAASPDYLWGGTVDNAMQPVATSPWTTRDSVPLTQAGYTRLLDSIEQIFASGGAHPELAPLLARAGIGYVVVANDLDTFKSGVTRSVFVQATLSSTPGLTLRASTGPRLGGSLSTVNVLDGGSGVARPAVQIYGVDGWNGLVGLDPLRGAVEATGSSDALPQLVAAGLPARTPVLFGADADGVPVPDATAVTTDGIRRQQATFGGLFTKSDTMTATARYGGQPRAAYDYLPSDPGPLSVMAYRGIADVTASSSGSDIFAFVNRDPAHAPWAALDGDPSTMWASGTPTGAVRQWLQVDFVRPITTRTARIRFGAIVGPLPTQVVVRTDTGFVTGQVRPTTSEQTIGVPSGPTRTLRITVARVADRTPGTSVGIADLSIPGVTPSRALQVPRGPAPAMLSFSAALGHRGQCLDVGARTVCDPTYVQHGEDDADLARRFTLGAPGEYQLAATVRLRGGSALDALLDAGRPVRASASSVNSADPRQRAGAAVDGNPRTAWQAAAGDVHPELTLRIGRSRAVRGLTIANSSSLAVVKPIDVEITAGAARWSGRLPDDGHVRFDRPVRTNKITIRVRTAQLRKSTSSVSLQSRLVPAGIGEVRLDTATALPRPAAGTTVTVGCRAGVALDVDGRSVPMQVTAARADMLAGRPVRATPCDDSSVTLGPGEHDVSLRESTVATPVTVTLSRPGTSLASNATAGTATVRKWDTTERRVRVDTAEASILVVRENENAGWRADVDGHRLAAVRVDGWQQGFVVPAGTHGVVVLTYAPQRPFVIGLLVGLLCAIALVVLAVVAGRSSRAGPLGAARVPEWLQLGALALAAGLLAGRYGVLTVGVAWLVLGVLGWRRRGVPVWVGGALLVVAGLLMARADVFHVFAQANSPGSQVLCVAAVVAAAFGGAARRPRQGRDP